MRKLRAAVVIAAGALLVAACGSDNKSSSSSTSAGASTGGGARPTINLTQGGNVNIDVVTHGQASDPFWSVVKKGVDDAAKDTGAKVNYSAPDPFDMVTISQRIDAAVAHKP